LPEREEVNSCVKVADEPVDHASIRLEKQDRGVGFDVVLLREIDLLFRVEAKGDRLRAEQGFDRRVLPRGLIQHLAGAAPGGEKIDEHDLVLGRCSLEGGVEGDVPKHGRSVSGPGRESREHECRCRRQLHELHGKLRSK